MSFHELVRKIPSPFAQQKQRIQSFKRGTRKLVTEHMNKQEQMNADSTRCLHLRSLVGFNYKELVLFAPPHRLLEGLSICRNGVAARPEVEFLGEKQCCLAKNGSEWSLQTSKRAQRGENDHPHSSRRVGTDESGKLKAEDKSTGQAGMLQVLNHRMRSLCVIGASSAFRMQLLCRFDVLLCPSILSTADVQSARMPVCTLLQKACILGYRAISCVGGSSDTSCITLSFWQTQ